jgi:hypothetical protein
LGQQGGLAGLTTSVPARNASGQKGWLCHQESANGNRSLSSLGHAQ